MNKDDTLAPMSQEFLDLADQYEGNLLNYFCGMSPKESKKFNQLIKNNKRRKNS